MPVAPALQVVPPLPDREREALASALARAGLPLDGSHPAYASPWRLAGLREAVSAELPRVAYTLSPRSTRGATRA